MNHKQFPEKNSALTEDTSPESSPGAGALVSRLSAIILLHTMAIFVGLLLLFFFPNSGPNEEDTKAQDAELLAIANTLASRSAESAGKSKQIPPDSAGSAMRKIFSSAAEKYPDVRRQALFGFSRIDDHQSNSLLMEWENDLASARRVSSVDRELEANLARSLEASRPDRVVKVTATDREHSWRFVVVDGESDGAGYVYVIVMADHKPVLGGWRFLTSLLLVFLSSILVSLLIVYMLNRKISRPLEKLKFGLAALKNSAANYGEPVTICSTRSELVDPIIRGFNELSSSLCLSRKKLEESRDEMKQSLRESAEARFFLETMIETTPNAIIVSDLAGEILIFNHTGRSMFGYGEDDPLPTQAKSLFKPKAEENAILSQQFSDIAKSERLCIRGSGEVFPALVYVSTIKGPDGGAKGLLYVVNDISRSENFSRMIMRLDRISIRGEMAEDIVHEINNYITVIQGNAELLSLLIHKGDTEKTEKRLNAIIENVKRISTFMSGMMSFEPSNVEFEREDLNQLIHNLISFLKPQKRLRHVEIELDLSPDIGIQELSAAMFQQLLVNLIYNSADALAGDELERNGRIKIETTITGSNSILLTVSDNGPGIAEEYLETLFEKSFSTKRKGHGIGLVTCSQIVNSHNGRIRYTGSAATGARFEIELPKSLSESIPSVSIEAPDESLRANK